MHYVSLIVEFLRGRPALVFWAAALTQGALWTIVPSLFYSAPPGEVALLLAVGHEFRLGSYLGPPLAFWFAEIMFRIAGMFGVYLLAQLCVVAALWAVFRLGQMIVGTRHAVLAILLLTGIFAFSIATPDFGPAVLAMPFWALALLHYWRAIGEDGRGYWYLLAFDLGLLLLTSYAGLLLVALLLVYSLATRRGRQAFTAVEPWLAVILLAIVVLPHIVWLNESWPMVRAAFGDSARPGLHVASAFGYVALIVANLSCMLLLIVLASGWRAPRHQRAPEIDGSPAPPAARRYVYFFALAPVIVATAAVGWLGGVEPLTQIAPLVLLGGLAAVALAGDRIFLYRERAVSMAWAGLLLAPPVLAVFALLVLPWAFAIELKVGQPAAAMGRFFADIFQRRTGQPLGFIAGDPSVASLVALAAPSRPVLYLNSAPERGPWTSAAEFRRHGGVLVWPATDTAGTPPADLKTQFPELSPEIPRAFARAVQGRLALLRIGWAVIRPQAEPGR